jgi:TonB-linked SusC/RagA family outer membrane protein
MYKNYTNKPGIPEGYIHKIWLIMRLTTVLFIATLMQVSAAGFGQKITIVKQHIALSEVFKEIRKQTGYNVLWQSDQVNTSKTVDLKIKNQDLIEALDLILNKHNLNYTIDEETITVTPKAPSFLEGLAERWAVIDVRGRVVDEKGDPLAGATVTVKATGKFVVTNGKGEFYLQGVEEGLVLVVSYIGYTNREVPAKKDLGEIRLVMASADLQEVEINKGYYTEKKSLSTGSVGRVTAEEIGKQPVFNPLQALQGRVAGLVITQQTGMYGGNFDIKIRGQNSLRNSSSDNGNTPLFIIDGMPYYNTPLNTNASITLYPQGRPVSGSSPLNALNPQDIESIEILKDADATSIYGSRGANGVILITTKKGKIGKMSLNVNIYKGQGGVSRKMHLLNTSQYLEMRREALKNDNATISASDYDLNGGWDQNRSNDWQHELLGGTAKTTDALISVSGGDNNTQYRFGGGYHKETTVFPGDFANHRASFQMNLSNTSPNQRFKSQLSLNYSLGFINLLTDDLTKKALSLAPNSPVMIDDQGNLLWGEGIFDNPYSFAKQPYNNKNNNLIANMDLSYKLIGNLVFRTRLGYTNSISKETKKTFVSAQVPQFQQYYQNITEFGNGNLSSWIIEPQLSYSKILGQSKIGVLIGSTFQNEVKDGLYQVASGFLNEMMMDNIASVPAANTSSTVDYSRYKYNAIFGRLNYDFKNKYIINVTARRDGSSRFGSGNQFANFGAIGAAWVFSNEEFIAHKLPFLNQGKLRGSYGISGSDQIPNYQFMDTFTTSGAGQYQQIAGIVPARLLNPNFRWENNRKLELALELGLWKDRVALNASYYKNRSSNQLVGYPLPPTAGFNTISYNLDATVQNTGFEFDLAVQNIRGKRVTWSTTFNATVPRNQLIAYPNLAGSSDKNSYVIGEPLSISKRYRFLGVNEKTGLYEIADVDGNGVYNTADFVVNKFIGQTLFGGLCNTINYNGLQLEILFQFVKQQGVNYLTNFQSPGTVGFNQPVEVIKRWREVGDHSNIQRFGTLVGTTYTRFSGSDAGVTDASFVRLKNISISYSLPKAFIEKLKIQTAKIYCQGQNILTITDYRGLDPESQGSSLPPLRVITVGLQVAL